MTENQASNVDLPTGTVTFLFTDIEGSTQLLQRLGDDFSAVNDAHLALVRSAILDEGGTIVRTEGDAFFAAFPSATGALRASLAAQRALGSHAWPDGVDLKVRMGMHTGEGVLGGDDYVGMGVVVAARIAATGHGGQVIVSDATAALVSGDLPPETTLKRLGEYRLKDLPDPVGIHQVLVQGMRSDFPALRTLDAVEGNLPEDLDSFVGRETELAAIVDLIGSTRLLTLVGPGGTGKTRLSIRAASDLGPEFADGTFFVALSTVVDPELVPGEILDAMGSKAPDSVSPREHSLTVLAGKQALLVLDNLEQLPDVAEYVAELLAETSVKVIATSRTPLHLSGERIYEIPPLELPIQASLEDLADNEAVRLFVERARAVRDDFELTEENISVVAELTQRLDGLPLAIELAANRTRVLSPGEILDRLGASMLSGGSKDREARQQTMWNAISWSHDLLSAPLQQLFARMSVFAGGGVLSEIEEVCIEGIELDVLEGVVSLVDHSLLRVRRLEPTRYSMLALLREFAAERLADGGEAEEVRARHAATYLAMAETAGKSLLGPERAQWLDRLGAEHDNLRAALDHWIETGATDEAMRMGAALWRYWQMRSHTFEGGQLLGRILQMPGGSPLNRLHAIEALGGLVYWQGDLPATVEHYEAALALAREIGDPAEVANALYNVSYPLAARPDTREAAVAALTEAMELFEGLSDDWGVVNTSGALADLLQREGRLDEAFEMSRKAYTLARKLGDDFRLSWAEWGMGVMLARRGEIEEARGHVDSALDMFLAADDRSALGLAIGGHAYLSYLEGDEERAATLLGAAYAAEEQTGTGLLREDFTDQEDPMVKVIGEVVAARSEAYEAGRALSIEEAIALARKRE